MIDKRYNIKEVAVEAAEGEIIMVTKTPIKVRYAETDKMGIVHHSNYAVWYEAARGDFIEAMGMRYSDMEEAGVMVPLVELHCKYIKPARYEENLIVECRIGTFRGAKLEFFYTVKNEDGIVINEGSTVHALTNTSLVPVNVKKTNPEVYEMLKRAYEGGFLLT